MRPAARALAWIALLSLTALPVLALAPAPLPDARAPAEAGASPAALLARTLAVGAGAAALATVLGAPAGFLLGRTDVPLRGAFRVAFAVPLVVPPLILAVAFEAHLPRGATGAALVLGLWLFPLLAFATEAVARRADPGVEEAARLLEPSRAAVFRRVTLPLAAPGIAAAALLAFALAIGDLGVPVALGARVHASEVFVDFAGAHDPGAAARRCGPLVLLAVAAALGAHRLWGRRAAAAIGARGERPPPAVALGRAGRALGLAWLSALAAVGAVAPALGLLRRTTPAVLASSARLALPAAGESLALAAAGATAALVLGLLVAAARPVRARLARGLEGAALVALFALPPAAVGIGLLRVLALLPALDRAHDAGALAVAALAGRFAPLAALLLAALRERLPPSLEEAAALLGHGFASTLGRVLAPLLATGIAVAWLLGFVLALGELGATFPVLPAGRETLPARVFSIHANAPDARVAASSLLVFAVAAAATAALLAGARLLARRRP